VAVHELSGAFRVLAEIGPSWLGGMTQGIGQLVTSWRVASKAVKEYGAESDAANAAQLAFSANIATLALNGILYLGRAQAKADALTTALINLKFEATKTFADAIRALGAYADSFIAAIQNAKTLAEAQQAIANLTTEIEFQKSAMQTLADTAAKYGFTLEELGPAMQRQNLDQRAQELYKDFKVLTAGWIEVGAAVTRMSDATNAYIKDAIAMGVEVPSAMKPMLQRMVDMGLLTDANGNKITDLEGSGISFAETMTEGFSRVVEEVKKLTEAIARGLGLAIDNIPKNTQINIDINERTTKTVVGGPDPFVPADDPFAFDRNLLPAGFATGGMVGSMGQVQHFATGGLVDTVPAMLTPGEMVLTKAQQRSVFGAGGVQVGSVVVHMTVDKDTDQASLAENFKAVLRSDATVYEAVSVVARRATA
jgi:hypothetical protein